MTWREVIIASASAIMGYIVGRLRQSSDDSSRRRITYTPSSTARPAGSEGTWQVIMSDAGPRKIEVIRILRAVTRLGLKESKDLVEARPPVTLVAGVSEDTARRMALDLEQAGAKAIPVP